MRNFISRQSRTFVRCKRAMKFGSFAALVVLFVLLETCFLILITNTWPPPNPTGCRDDHTELVTIPEIRAEIAFKNCGALFEEGTNISKLVAEVETTDQTPQQRGANEYLNMVSDRDAFRRGRKYILHPLTETEHQFPIAFSILIYKDLERFERLLRMIYRPQNYYCVHVDAKSPDEFMANVTGITDCFPNVFLSPERYKVEWGELSVLQPEISCMKQLLMMSKSWKYFINLTGHEAPLKTNYELVNILKTYNGANDVQGTIRRSFPERYATQLKYRPLPDGVTVVRGAVHVVLSRGFVEFATHAPVAKYLYNWFANTTIPDEYFFATLNHNPQLGAPGAYTGKIHETDPVKLPFLARYKIWRMGPVHPCAGDSWRNGICVFTAGDLPTLSRRPELFANKFEPSKSPVGFDCLEELYFNRTREQFLDGLSASTIDLSYYKSLAYVSDHVKIAAPSARLTV
ncbi:beta-1,3-galactosyl-O-glycosyl-glycoprotein beta-1,6-N-acetylglucosaminyltransferase-like [Tubulanus polymorphus]|uniref:beta-1,3-galactosyl-O-glycosyl-glycoprotein beta-1,6-N-acetylglucosaminyltransferase-like n=1 Tax=Tubulanus polymorphus TaxID=672921 RepID=UPI003DA3AE7B